MSLEARYREALQWIHGLGRFGIKPGLERITALLQMLGNPHGRLSYVHIAGSNGKGSTAAMLASVLRAAGYSCGLYTSPYLLSFTNRMAVDGDDIGQEDLVTLVEKVKPLVEEISADENLGDMTEFEVVTALALLYFAEQKPDLVVLEAGLGGRLDATNVVIPLLSIITNISLEHTAVLGNTITAIAGEKAGIIKAGRPLVTAADHEDALALFRERCLELEVPFYRVFPTPEREEQMPAGKPAALLKKIDHSGQLFSYRGLSVNIDDLFVNLRGAYQLTNTATALTAIELLAESGFEVEESSIRKGLAEVSWPGRLELLQEKPQIVLDGAHNPAAMEKLVQSFPRYFNYRRLILVIGMLADKDTAAMLEHILPLAERVIFTRPAIDRAADPEIIAAFALEHLKLEKDYMVMQNYGEALDKAIEIAEPEDVVLVTGSLYTVSDIRAYWKDHRKL